MAIARPGEALEFDSAKVPDGAHELQLLVHGTDGLGTIARAKVPCVIRNETSDVEVEAKAAGELPWDQPLRVRLRAKGAKELVLRQMGRDVGRIEGAEGTIDLDLRTLGQGPVKVQTVALMDGGKEVFGKTLEFRVVPAAAIASTAVPSGKMLVEGFHVSAGKAAPKVVKKAAGKWLEEAGVDGFHVSSGSEA